MLRRALAAARPERGDRVLVALSGGADSVALLLGVVSLHHEFGIEPRAAHLHHGLRGAAADADLAFVTALCRRLAVPLAAARWDTARRMRSRSLAGHAGLRVLRREFLLAEARRAGARFIATAHTADDQLETLLMRLLRGSGLPGLAGMRPRRGVWLKPLLEATRRDVERDLAALGQSWCDDASNRDPRYLRARVRDGVIPALLEAMHAPPRGAARGDVAGAGRNGARDALSRDRLARRAAASVTELREAEAALRNSARRLIARHPGTTSHSIAAAPLRAARPALRRAALRRVWREVAPSCPGLLHAHLEALLGLLSRGRPGAAVALPAGRVARLVSGALTIQIAAVVPRGGRAGGRGGSLAAARGKTAPRARLPVMAGGSRSAHE